MYYSVFDDNMEIIPNLTVFIYVIKFQFSQRFAYFGKVRWKLEIDSYNLIIYSLKI